MNVVDSVDIICCIVDQVRTVWPEKAAVVSLAETSLEESPFCPCGLVIHSGDTKFEITMEDPSCSFSRYMQEKEVMFRKSA